MKNKNTQKFNYVKSLYNALKTIFDSGYSSGKDIQVFCDNVTLDFWIKNREEIYYQVHGNIPTGYDKEFFKLIDESVRWEHSHR